MADPYVALGVERTASADELRAAYRKLAKQFHPDLNPGNRQAEERFKEVQGAYDLLSDAEKRARFDRGEIDDTGAERPPRWDPGASWRGHAEAPRGGRYAPDMEDLFADLFGNARARGGDRLYRLGIDFLEAVNGARRRIDLPDGRSLDVTIPAGVQSGQVLRLKGQGDPGLGDGPAGDALIELAVAPHPELRRDGDDIRLELAVPLKEAVLGGRLTVPTPGGPVAMRIPPGSDTGKVLRLKGKGVAGRGDQYVTLKVVIGQPEDPALKAFLEGWEPSP